MDHLTAVTKAWIYDHSSLTWTSFPLWQEGVYKTEHAVYLSFVETALWEKYYGHSKNMVNITDYP